MSVFVLDCREVLIARFQTGSKNPPGSIISDWIKKSNWMHSEDFQMVLVVLKERKKI